jgi:hypothetical protein
MSEVVDPSWKARSMRLEPEHHDEARQIAKELAGIARSGLVLPGSIVERRTVCGRANCACHKDPSRRHGPYFQWTRKVAKKTVGKWISADQNTDYQIWVRNDRRAHELLARLETLGIAALETDTRTRHGSDSTG